MNEISAKAEALVEAIGACTEDVRDCEVMRTAIFLKDTEPSNEASREIRFALATLACSDCKAQYLKDLRG